VKVVDWFTVFFIPIFPYLTRYALICPLCDAASEVNREEIGDLLKELRPLDPVDTMSSSKYEDEADKTGDWILGGGSENAGHSDKPKIGRYEGKNATQIAYLAKLEARDKELEAQREKEEREEKKTVERETGVRGIRDRRESQSGRTAQDDRYAQGARREQQAAANAAAKRTMSARLAAIEVREDSLAAREIATEAREKAVEAREKAVEVREKAAEVRRKALETRESARKPEPELGVEQEQEEQEQEE